MKNDMADKNIKRFSVEPGTTPKQQHLKTTPEMDNKQGEDDNSNDESDNNNESGDNSDGHCRDTDAPMEQGAILLKVKRESVRPKKKSLSLKETRLLAKDIYKRRSGMSNNNPFSSPVPTNTTKTNITEDSIKEQLLENLKKVKVVEGQQEKNLNNDAEVLETPVCSPAMGMNRGSSPTPLGGGGVEFIPVSAGSSMGQQISPV